MTFPEDAVLRRPASPAKAPSQALGFFLNFFLPGAGFSLIGRWGWHLGWFGILAALNVVVAILSLISSSPLLLLLPLIGFIVMHVHFARIYDWHEERGVWPPLEPVLKAVLIAGHFFVGFILTGILAAVLIPNLLGARERAMQVGEQATARNVYARVMVQDVDETLRSGPCDLHELPESSRATLAACTVELRDGGEPALNLTFDSGRQISLP
ncbi:hypothetical protein [Deinococcus marmoris]|uniref:Uncharacterized protein n=1 Tax=Deinococcus marmoris TaxID=249408 RepID=A0A1U7NS87_9DEIO|nr:hypothetical protein [Deinococcus marmoris]OLV15776.1 hypothetical protein BOO71_0013948 [Deinococcus marmoris]